MHQYTLVKYHLDFSTSLCLEMAKCLAYAQETRGKHVQQLVLNIPLYYYSDICSHINLPLIAVAAVR